MTAYTRTLQVSETQYQSLVRQARAAKKTVEEYAENLFAQSLPAPQRSSSEQRRHDLQQLDLLDDATLWKIFESEFPEDKWEVYEGLLDANAKRELTMAEQNRLDILRGEANLMMLRRAYSARFLHERGYDIPNPYAVIEDE